MKTLLISILLVSMFARGELILKASAGDPNENPFEAQMWLTNEFNILKTRVFEIKTDPNEVKQWTRCSVDPLPWMYQYPCDLVWQEYSGQTNESGFMTITGVIAEVIHMAEGDGNETRVCDWTAPHSTHNHYYAVDAEGNRISNVKQVETLYASGHDTLPNGIYPWPELHDPPPRGWRWIEGNIVFDIATFCSAWLECDDLCEPDGNNCNEMDVNHDGGVDFEDLAILTGV